MDQTNHMTLYSSQSVTVTNILQTEGVCFSKEKYVKQKYQESAPVFVAAYGWFVRQLPRFVPKPDGAEYPYWAFRDIQSVEACGDVELLTLEVPVDQAVFFDMYDWIKIMRLQYIGEETEVNRFRKKITDYGIRQESDIMVSNFYPDLKREIEASWEKLFRYHEQIKAGDFTGVGSVQAGLWQLRKEWLK